MKILFAGNLANLGYRIAKQLRIHNVDVTLLMENNPSVIDDPTKNDKSLEGNFPKWIKFYDRSSKIWPLKIIQEIRKKKYDLVHAFVELPIYAQFSKKTFVVQTTGSDLRELAFTNSVRGFLLRRAYRKCKVLLHSSPDFFPLLPKLGIKNDIFLPVPVDYEYYCPKPDENKLKKELVIFHPARLEWRLKGNNIFIEGAAKFIKINPNVKLIIVDRGIDSQSTHNLISKLQIEKHVEYIHGPLNSQQLLNYYQLSDLVADQFIVSSIGGIGLETFSCGKPLITNCPQRTYLDNYLEDPPLLHASTSNDIFNALVMLSDIHFREKLGSKARLWIKKYHSSELYIKKLLVMYELILKNQNILKIRSEIKLTHI